MLIAVKKLFNLESKKLQVITRELNINVKFTKTYKDFKIFKVATNLARTSCRW